MGVRADLREADLGPCNTWLVDTLDLESLYTSIAAGEVRPRSLFLTSATLKDPGTAHAPDGISSLQVMALSPGSPGAWGLTVDEIESGAYRASEHPQACKRRVEETVLERITRAFPAFEDAIAFCETSTPISQMRFASASGGTGFGLAAVPSQFLGARPDHRGPVPGLYLAGSSTRNGPGIGSVMASGTAAAARLLEDT